MSMFKRAYCYRCYPTNEQQQILARTCGCARWIYNWALALKSRAYQEEGKRLSYGDLSACLPVLKRQPETAWLAEVSSVPLQQSLRHLDRAFVNFFEGRGKYPRFKSKKRGSQTATYTVTAFTWRDGTLTLAKMDAPLEIRWSRPLPEGTIPSTVTVSRDNAGRYFVSLLVEEKIEPLPPSPEQIGADLGLTSMVITSKGEKVGNPRFFATDEKKLAKAQKRHARKHKNSKNQEKARRKVAKIHARIADRRRDYQHKLSTRLIRENQVICVESLAVKNMMQNHSLAKAVADVGWGEFVRQLAYKAQWYGRTLIKIDRWFPSSKICSCCGSVLESLDLEVREWMCPNCGTHHDRDVNAANTVLTEGLRLSAAGLAVLLPVEAT
jgi:putative transposase